MGDTKSAALYFDHVVPLMMLSDIVQEMGGYDSFMEKFDLERDHEWLMHQRRQLDAFIPDMLRDDSRNYRQWADLNMNIVLRCMWLAGPDTIEDKNTRRDAEKASRDHHAHWNRFVRKFNGYDCHFLATRSAVDKQGISGDVAITLHGLDLIDTSRATLDHVIEFRNDKEAMYKLRKLRLFAMENYSDKSLLYIEDDLQRRIFEYEEARKKWGFETRRSAATVLLDSKLLQIAGGSSLLVSVLGAPLMGGIAMLGSIAVEMGRACLAVAKTRVDARGAMLDMPASYICSAREALSMDKS